MVKKSLKAAVALFLCAMLAVGGACCAMAESADAPEDGGESKDAVESTAAGVTSHPGKGSEEVDQPADPEPTESAPEPSEPSDPDQTQKLEPTPSPTFAPPQVVAAPPKPEPEPEVREYTITWSANAFASQTINHQDELVLGFGATYTIDSSNDVLILVDGARAKTRPKGISISYASSNSKYLIVTPNGQLKAARRGSAQLFVTAQLPDGTQKQLRKNVKIVDEPHIRFAPDSALLGDGDSLDLSQFAKAPLLMASPNVNAGVTYSVTPLDATSDSAVTLDRVSGHVSVRYTRPGDTYLITAKTFGGQKATFTLYLGLRTQRIEIKVSSEQTDENGNPALRPGEKQSLQAKVYNTLGELAESQEVTWVIIGGGQYASISGEGMLAISGAISGECTVLVAAMACDGSGVTAQTSVRVLP